MYVFRIHNLNNPLKHDQYKQIYLSFKKNYPHQNNYMYLHILWKYILILMDFDKFINFLNYPLMYHRMFLKDLWLHRVFLTSVKHSHPPTNNIEPNINSAKNKQWDWKFWTEQLNDKFDLFRDKCSMHSQIANLNTYFKHKFFKIVNLNQIHPPKVPCLHVGIRHVGSQKKVPPLVHELHALLTEKSHWQQF